MNRRLSLEELARRRKVQVQLETSPRACLTLLDLARTGGPLTAAQALEELTRTNPLLEDLPHPDAPPRHLVTSWRSSARRWIGDRLRRAADRVDPEGAPL